MCKVYECLTRYAVDVYCRWLALVAILADALYQRYLCQQRTVHFLCEVLCAVFAEDVVLVVGQFGRREVRHILHQTKNWHIHFFVSVHIYALTRIGKCHILRGADDDCARDSQSLEKREVNVARARRRIENEIVQLAPIGIGNQLLQSVASHTATPQRCGVGVYEKADGKQLHTILFDGFDELPTVFLYGERAFLLYAKHLWHTRTEHVGVQQAHLVAQASQGNGEIGRYGALAHAAFSRTDGDYILHLRQHFAHLRAWRRLEFGVYFYFHIFAHRVVYLRFGSLDSRLHKGVCLARKHQSEAHFVSIDAYIVGKHFAFYEVFLCSGVHYLLQCVGNEFWI